MLVFRHFCHSHRRTSISANMIHSLAILLLAALAAAEPAGRRVASAEVPVSPASAPALAYVAAPLVVGAQRAAVPAPAQLVLEPSARTVVAYAAQAPQQQQYFARTYNGITTLTLEPRDASPASSAPLVVAPAAPAPSRYVLAEPARFVQASAPLVLQPEPAPAPARVLAVTPQAQQAAPQVAVAAPEARYFAFTSQAAPQVAVAAPAARFIAVTPQAAPQVAVAAPASSSSQFFSRNFNGVPTVTYFVVGPAPVTAPVAVAPQQDAGARPSRRPVPGAVPSGEPVNQGDVEVLDA